MPELKLKIKDYGKIQAALQKSPTTVLKHVQEAIKTGSMMFYRTLQLKAPADTSNLARTVETVLKPLKAEIYPTAKYAIFVHEGTKPHFVSAKKLEKWARHKGVNPYAVAKAIAKRGTKANPFMDKTAQATFPDIEKMFNDKLKQAIDQVAKEAA